MLLQLGLRWSQVVSDASASLRGPFSIFPRGSLPVSLLLGASSTLFVSHAFLLLGWRVSFLGCEGFFAVNALLRFSEHLGHACLRIL